MSDGVAIASNAYKQIFGGRPDVKVFAPGRVNLIGTEFTKSIQSKIHTSKLQYTD